MTTPGRSPYPDGVPSPLPPGIGGASSRGRVVQRFSGTGLTPKPKVRRQERRARRATIVLAALAMLVIVSSAILIFNPSFELPSFGFALNQRTHKQASDVPLYVDGTPPPTPTVSPAAQTPTPTPSNNPNTGPAATANPTPTPTPKPTPTPTPTPTVIPGGAVVKFTAPTSAISKNSFTGCASGCDFQTANGSGSGALSSGGSYGPSGWQSTRVAGPYKVTLSRKRYCFLPNPTQGIYKCVIQYNGWNPNDFGNPDFTMDSGNFTCKYIKIPAVANGAAVRSSWCWWYTTDNPVYANRFCGTTGYTSPTQSDQSFYVFTFNFCNDQWNSVESYKYITSTDCNNAISSADTPAKNAANSAMSSWIGGRVALDQSTALINNASVRYCSPSAGTHTTSKTTGHVEWSWSATAFDPNTAVTAASNYIKSHVPASYILTAGPTTCSASQAGSSGSYSYSGGSSGTVTVTCAASGTATYDWTSASQGMSAQASLKQAIAGKTLAQAQSICNSSYPGIVPGSCTIQLVGGNVSVVPADTSKIQIQPS